MMVPPVEPASFSAGLAPQKWIKVIVMIYASALKKHGYPDTKFFFGSRVTLGFFFMYPPPHTERLRAARARSWPPGRGSEVKSPVNDGGYA